MDEPLYPTGLAGLAMRDQPAPRLDSSDWGAVIPTLPLALQADAAALRSLMGGVVVPLQAGSIAIVGYQAALAGIAYAHSIEASDQATLDEIRALSVRLAQRWQQITRPEVIWHDSQRT